MKIFSRKYRINLLSWAPAVPSPARCICRKARSSRSREPLLTRSQAVCKTCKLLEVKQVLSTITGLHTYIPSAAAGLWTSWAPAWWRRAHCCRGSSQVSTLRSYHSRSSSRPWLIITWTLSGAQGEQSHLKLGPTINTEEEAAPAVLLDMLALLRLLVWDTLKRDTQWVVVKCMAWLGFHYQHQVCYASYCF